MRLFRPLLAGAHLRDRLTGCVGAAICIPLTMIVCAGLPLEAADVPVIVAPLGASAVLAFAVPASPLAQPWPVVGGNIVSALVGIAAFRIVPDLTVAAGVAVGAAILAMSLLRCLHPPGGAAALTAVIGSPGIHDAGFAFAFAPVGLNSIALVSLAIAFHRTTLGNYPHRPVHIPAAPPGLHRADIDAALDELGDGFDIVRDDLDALLFRAGQHAAVRHGGPPPPPLPEL